MGCLFCDQTPESVNAREKLAAIAKLIDCHVGSVVSCVRNLLTENIFLKQRLGWWSEIFDKPVELKNPEAKT